jgi:putative Holliday junction resolvase
MDNDNKKYLGIDWGAKRIGLSIAESDSMTAVPYDTVGGLEDVLKAVEKEEVDEVVLGLPIKLSGSEEFLTPAFNDFFEELKDKLDIPIRTVDERLSSRAADSLPGSKKDKAARDEIAAMLILQSFLDRNQ